MNVEALAPLMLGAYALIRRLLGRPFREWSEFARDYPEAAAEQLELISRVLAHRADAYRRPEGWRARRDRSVSRALMEHAAALRDRGLRELACRCKPGRWALSEPPPRPDSTRPLPELDD